MRRYVTHATTTTRCARCNISIVNCSCSRAPTRRKWNRPATKRDRDWTERLPRTEESCIYHCNISDGRRDERNLIPRLTLYCEVHEGTRPAKSKVERRSHKRDLSMTIVMMWSAAACRWSPAALEDATDTPANQSSCANVFESVTCISLKWATQSFMCCKYYFLSCNQWPTKIQKKTETTCLQINIIRSQTIDFLCKVLDTV